MARLKNSGTIVVLLIIIAIALIPTGGLADEFTGLRNTPDFPPAAPDVTGHGRQMQIRLSLPGSSEGQPLKGQADADELKGGLTQLELHRLAAHDIVLFIDKSFSMSTTDCPLAGSSSTKLGSLSSLVLGLGGMTASRWDWCVRQIEHMVRQTERALTNGFTVVLFDNRFSIFQHVTVPQLSNIYASNHPGGGTILGEPLACTFSDYFRRKKISHGNVKPLLIGVITDGCPHDPDAVRDEVISATRSVHDPNEITIIFFLIGGNDANGNRFVWKLCHELINRGARYQAVKSVPFDELERLGLARALADNLN